MYIIFETCVVLRINHSTQPDTFVQLKNRVDDIENFQDKLSFIDDVVFKTKKINQEKTRLLVRDIETYKKDFIWKNLRQYTATKYLSWSWSVDFLKKSKKIYQIAKIKNIKVDIHPNYLNTLELTIKNNSNINEKSDLFKLYSYVLYWVHIQGKINNFSTLDQKFSELSFFWNSQEFISHSWYYLKRFEKLKKLENINPLSKTDFAKISAKIKSEKLSPDSDYVKWFFGWYAINKKILSSTSVFVTSVINHTKQEYSLSCEANSTKTLINYYLNEKWINIDENYILSQLPSYTWAISKDNSWALFWADPNEVFVWDITGKQSSNHNRFNWYWVYATPLVKIINSTIEKYNLKAKKTNFSEDIIFDSIIKWHPVVFWYLTPVIKWKSYSYETRPIVWKTQSWKLINGYLWEHTWIITGFDIDNNWKITNIYFYEWNKKELQKINIEDLKKLASYFDEMIIVENKKPISNIVFK